MRELQKEIHERVIRRLDLSRETSDTELREVIREEICIAGRKQYLSLPQRLELERKVFASLRRFDVLEDLLEDDEITEIMVNGPDRIFIERAGKLEETDLAFLSAEKLDDVIQKIAGENNRIANAAHPIMDARLADGSRVNIVLPPVAVDHSVITIRKFPKEPITMETLLEWGSLSEELAVFLKTVVRAGYNIFVSGGTGSGKTTFLNAMAEFIPEGERVITIEEAAELQLLGVRNLIRLEVREATMEGKLEVTIRDLLRTSLRMRPDRIIVGECRGAEALEMLQAFNTGHDGSFSTGHANSAEDMMARLETMVLMSGEMPLPAVRSQIASGVDLVVHLGRMRDRTRKVLEIAEVVGIRQGEVCLETLYEFAEEGGEREVRGHWEQRHCLRDQRKLKRAGLSLEGGP